MCSIVLEQSGVIILLHQVADATSGTPRDPYFKTHYCTNFHELRLHLTAAKAAGLAQLLIAIKAHALQLLPRFLENLLCFGEFVEQLIG
jgi:hypothetical protein